MTSECGLTELFCKCERICWGLAGSKGYDRGFMVVEFKGTAFSFFISNNIKTDMTGGERAQRGTALHIHLHNTAQTHSETERRIKYSLICDTITHKMHANTQATRITGSRAACA